MNARALAFAALVAVAVPGLAQAQAVNALINDLAANCNVIIYEEDCMNAVRKAVNGSKTAADPDKARVNAALTDLSTKHPQIAPRIKEVTEAR
jgi:hypothetical protein